MEQKAVNRDLADAASDNAPGSRSAAPESAFAGHWVAFRQLSGPRLPCIQAAAVARAMRKALQSHASEPVPEIISGHRPSGEPSLVNHAAFVPLPSVGSDRATGDIAGLAIAVPRTASDIERRQVVAAVEAWEASECRDDEETPVLSLRLGSLGVLALERVAGSQPGRSLRHTTWAEPAERWASVTPIALDRFPGKLTSRDPKATAEAQAIIRQSCVYAGLPEPDSVTIRWKSPVRKAPAAADFPPYPGIPGRQARFCVHALITFAKPVAGPVLLGAGRHEGMGLMRPW